jgi:hypothetical protein
MNHHKCAPKNSTCKADELPLPHAKVASALCNVHAQAKGVGLHFIFEANDRQRVPQGSVINQAQRI